MPTFGREKTLFPLAKTKVSLHRGGPSSTSGQSYSQGPAARLPMGHPCVAVGQMPCFTLAPGWQGSKGCRLLNCRYFLPLRSTLCWKLCFYKQSWGLFLCVCWRSWEDLWDTTLGILPLFIIMFRCCLGRAGCRCAQVIPALRGF